MFGDIYDSFMDSYDILLGLDFFIKISAMVDVEK
jgi:hypothetical protein